MSGGPEEIDVVPAPPLSAKDAERMLSEYGMLVSREERQSEELKEIRLRLAALRPKRKSGQRAKAKQARASRKRNRS